MTAPIQLLQQLRQYLAAQFPERREVIEGALYALLSSESVLLLGPPDPQTLCASSPNPGFC
jgi:MoxR-like ATPase